MISKESILYARFFFYALVVYYLNFDVIIQNKHSIVKKFSNDLEPFNFFNENISNLNGFINFEKFNNVSGTNQYIVPNIIHYINLNQPEIKFGQYLSIISAWLNQKPDQIYIHCNKCNFSGLYWDMLHEMKELMPKIKVNKINHYNPKIFGLRAGWVHHKSDVLRLLVIMSFGGTFILNSF
jgi:hypothetical protein